MTLREEGKERRRQRILDAVVDLLRDEGLSELGVAKIADRARVSVATLYNLIGPLDDVIGAMVGRMFQEFQVIRLEPSDSGDPIDAIYRFIEATVQHFEGDPERYQAMLRAIFQLNIARGPTEPVLNTAERNQDAMRAAIAEASEIGLIQREANPELLAEQMLTGQMMLLQAWSMNLISLERYRLSCLYLFSTSLRAWAKQKLTPRLDKSMRLLQVALEELEKPTDSPARQSAFS